MKGEEKNILRVGESVCAFFAGRKIISSRVVRRIVEYFCGKCRPGI